MQDLEKVILMLDGLEPDDPRGNPLPDTEAGNSLADAEQRLLGNT